MMTFSYDEDALTNVRDRIRLEIGDTMADRQILQNEEIEEVMADNSSFSAQVAQCCRLAAAKFAAKPQSITMEGFKETTTEIYNRFIEMAKRWEAKGSYPWAGSINVDFKETNELDTSIVAPKFKLGIHNNS